MNKHLLSIGVLNVILASGSVMAAEAEQLAQTCVACHGQNGISSIPTYPNLAGQKEQYLADALLQYKTGKRQNPIMQPMVASLSEEDIKKLAAYYAEMEPAGK